MTQPAQMLSAPYLKASGSDRLAATTRCLHSPTHIPTKRSPRSATTSSGISAAGEAGSQRPTFVPRGTEPLAGAHREELKDRQLLSRRTELRSNRLNGSGMNKIVRNRSATPYSIRRELIDISHWEYSLHDRIPGRRTRYDHPLDQFCSDASRDPL